MTDIGPAPAPAPAPVPSGSFLTGVVSTLKLALAYANTPGGMAVVTGIIGATAPEVVLIEQFGIRLLGPLLDAWTQPTITDADVVASLTTKGYKVVPYDPMEGFK